MIENKSFVQEFNSTIGEGVAVTMETDTCFNNRLQAGYEAGTAAFAPMIEQNTTLISEANSCHGNSKQTLF